MRLFHTTHVTCVPSIVRNGILPSFARNATNRIWLHSRDQTAWAISHLSESHGWDIGSLITFTVDVPRSWLRRHRKGIWTCYERIEPARLSDSIISLQALDFYSDEMVG